MSPDAIEHVKEDRKETGSKLFTDAYDKATNIADRGNSCDKLSWKNDHATASLPDLTIGEQKKIVGVNPDQPSFPIEPTRPIQDPTHPIHGDPIEPIKPIDPNLKPTEKTEIDYDKMAEQIIASRHLPEAWKQRIENGGTLDVEKLNQALKKHGSELQVDLRNGRIDLVDYKPSGYPVNQNMGGTIIDSTESSRIGTRPTWEQIDKTDYDKLAEQLINSRHIPAEWKTKTNGTLDVEKLNQALEKHGSKLRVELNKGNADLIELPDDMTLGTLYARIIDSTDASRVGKREFEDLFFDPTRQQQCEDDAVGTIISTGHLPFATNEKINVEQVNKRLEIGGSPYRIAIVKGQDGQSQAILFNITKGTLVEAKQTYPDWMFDPKNPRNQIILD